MIMTVFQKMKMISGKAFGSIADFPSAAPSYPVNLQPEIIRGARFPENCPS
jgi:hypothetical protein